MNFRKALPNGKKVILFEKGHLHFSEKEQSLH